MFTVKSKRERRRGVREGGEGERKRKRQSLVNETPLGRPVYHSEPPVTGCRWIARTLVYEVGSVGKSTDVGTGYILDVGTPSGSWSWFYKDLRTGSFLKHSIIDKQWKSQIRKQYLVIYWSCRSLIYTQETVYLLGGFWR